MAIGSKMWNISRRSRSRTLSRRFSLIGSPSLILPSTLAPISKRKYRRISASPTRPSAQPGSWMPRAASPSTTRGTLQAKGALQLTPPPQIRHIIHPQRMQESILQCWKSTKKMRMTSGTGSGGRTTSGGTSGTSWTFMISRKRSIASPWLGLSLITTSSRSLVRAHPLHDRSNRPMSPFR